MNTEAIRLFIQVARLLNISAAGEMLNLTATVASARLASLEKKLDMQLIQRTTRRVSLSVAGERFLPYAEEIIAQEDAARAVLGLDQVQPKGRIRFAAPVSFAQKHIAPLLPSFLKLYPQIELDLHFSDSIVGLVEGGFDLALRNSILDDSSFRARKLADDNRLLCASKDYLNEYGYPETPSDLSQHQMLSFRKQKPLVLIDAKGKSYSIDALQQSRVLVDSGDVLRQLSVLGAGISVNSYWSVYEQLKTGELQRVLPSYQVDDLAALWLIYPRSYVLNAKVRVFIDFLVENINLQVPEGMPE